MLALGDRDENSELLKSHAAFLEEERNGRQSRSLRGGGSLFAWRIEIPELYLAILRWKVWSIRICHEFPAPSMAALSLPAVDRLRARPGNCYDGAGLYSSAADLFQSMIAIVGDCSMDALSEYIFKASARDRVLMLAGLAVLSALATNYLPNDPWQFLIAPSLHGKDTNGAPLLPGIYFGLVLAIGAYAWKTRKPFELAIILAGTVIAWVFAWELAYRMVNEQIGLVTNLCKSLTEPLYEELKKFTQDPVDIPKCENNALSWYFYLSAGGVAGLVGGLLTVTGISLVTPDFRTVDNWLRTLFLSTAAGFLLAPSFENSPLLLYVPWQVLVAASIAYGWSYRYVLKR
jgi:hypothetical protein